MYFVKKPVLQIGAITSGQKAKNVFCHSVTHAVNRIHFFLERLEKPGFFSPLES